MLGFKCFLADSGSDDFPPVTARQMAEALAVLRGLGAPLLVHAESAAGRGGHRPRRQVPGTPTTWRRARAGWRTSRWREVIEAARQTGGHAHVVHLSSSDALPMIASARREGVPVTAESCPHYLALTAEEIEDGQTAFKCSPPIREAANRDLLWDGLRSGVLDMVVSDHSPVDAGDEAAQRGLRARVGRDLLAPARAACGVDAGEASAGSRSADVARWMAEQAGRARRPAPQGPDRARLRRGLLRLRSRRRVLRRP